MSLILDLSPSEVETLARRAESEGLSLTEYARRRLLVPFPTDISAPPKKFNVMNFAGIIPVPDEVIDAQITDIEASRNDWDLPDSRPERDVESVRQ